MPAPVVSVLRFNRTHNTPQPQQQKGRLHENANVETEGYLRGSDMGLGYIVRVTHHRGATTLYWSGTITERVADNYSRAEGDAWFFTVKRCEGPVSDGSGGGGGGDDTISVTVTSTGSSPQTSPVATPSPPGSDLVP